MWLFHFLNRVSKQSFKFLTKGLEERLDFPQLCGEAQDLRPVNDKKNTKLTLLDSFRVLVMEKCQKLTVVYNEKI